MSDEVVLFRCRTPTNVLCPCGAVERRLRKLEVEHSTERVAQGRRKRPEIEELTGQRRVPVLVDGDEVIHDSKRILQYLEWKYAKQEADGGSEGEQGGYDPAAPGSEAEDPAGSDSDEDRDASKATRTHLYNVKRWIRPTQR